MYPHESNDWVRSGPHAGQANAGHGCGGAMASGAQLHTDPELLRRMALARPGEAVLCDRPPPCNTINPPSELEVIKARLRDLGEQAANVRLRTRCIADKLFGEPPLEKAACDKAVAGEGPAIHAILTLINEASHLLSDTQAELARLEML